MTTGNGWYLILVWDECVPAGLNAQGYLNAIPLGCDTVSHSKMLKGTSQVVK